MLPFVRLLQGSADYTPRYLTGTGLKCTKAHQLALPFLLYSPIQCLFWAEPLQPISQSVSGWNKELNIWTRMPSVWDDTRFLHASIGESAAVARRLGKDWYVAAIGNNEEQSLTLDLNVLFEVWAGHPGLPPLPEQGYLVHSYKDGNWAKRPEPFMVKVAPKKFFWLKPPQKAWANGVEPTLPAPGVLPIPDGKFEVELAPSGGHVLYITPVTPKALKEME